MFEGPENLHKEEEASAEDADDMKLWENLLDLFGTDAARERFKDLCEKYYRYLVKAKARSGLDEKAAEISERGRAELHNKIMQTIYALMSQARIEPEEKQKFNALSDRKKVAAMVEDVFGPYSPAEKEKRERMTELGKFRMRE